jgi:hypothetical protein
MRITSASWAIELKKEPSRTAEKGAQAACLFAFLRSRPYRNPRILASQLREVLEVCPFMIENKCMHGG